MTLTTTKPEKPLIAKAMGFHTFREDRDDETELVAISYSESVEAMSRFTGGDPTRIHHLERDPEFFIELPQRVQILKIRVSHGNIGSSEACDLMRRFDHCDLRVPRLAEVTAFFEILLPALGFSQRVTVESWLQFGALGEAATEFFGLTESPAHVLNENGIAYWEDRCAGIEGDEVAPISAEAISLGVLSTLA